MLRKTLAAGLLAAAALAGAAPASAQNIQIGPDGIRLVPQEQGRGQEAQRAPQGGIGERDAVRVARAEGLHEVETVGRSDRAYRVVGYDRRGDDIQVDVDRRNGQVISVR